MFDSQVFDRLAECAGQVAAARTETPLATAAQTCDALRAVQNAQDILDGAHADLLAHLEASEAYTDDGASSTSDWARQQLRLGPGEARQRRRAGQTLNALPDVAAALASGKIRLAHVYEFTAAITKLGSDVMTDAQEILLPIAESSDPSVVREAITHLHEVLHPEELDKKYAKGMNRRDIGAAKCGTGWHVTGFLDPVVGAKFNQFLKDTSAPACEDDDRPPSDRRVDGLGELLDATDTPTDDAASTESRSMPHPRRRARAATQLLVLADLETLLRMPGAEPATLAGFGHIGDQLLGYLTCGADLSAVLTRGLTGGPVPQADILNVGRTARLATPAQRHAITARQHGVCAAPGCGLTSLEIHHVKWWHRDSGSTDLDNLIGICSRCHHLVHQNKLSIRPDGTGGFTFHRQTGARIDDHVRVSKQRIRDILAKLRHAIRADDEAHEVSAATVPQTNPPGGEAAQAQRLRSLGIEVRRIQYDDLLTTGPPP